MRKLFTIACAAIAAVSAAMAATVNVGYKINGELVGWGTGKAETYNAAILVDDATLVGKKVTAIQFNWADGVEATDCQAFIASELRVKSGVAVGDIATASYTAPAGGVCTVVLDEPWTIDRTPFYVGYSFKVGNPKDNEALQAPVLVGDCRSDGARYIATSRTYKGWQQPSILKGFGITVRAVVEGESSDDAAGVKSVSNPVTTADTPGQCTAVIVNHGSKEIRNIGYSYTVDGQTVTGTYAFDTPVPAELYGMTATMTFEAPVITERGEHEGTFTITKVNRTENIDPMASAQNVVSVTAELAKHVVVMEEFTGTWCKWCARGFVALRMLNEQLGDSFIALAYHSGDPMTVTDKFPVAVDGYPEASIERTTMCDPYYGTGNANFGILDNIQAHMAEAVPANLSVTAKYGDDTDTVEIDASAYFFRSYEENPFRLAYVLTADSLRSAEDKYSWLQANAYYNYPASELPGGEDFCKPEGKSYMSVAFDDVVVAYSPYEGEEESLPAAVKFDNSYSHSYSFDISNIKENAQTGDANKDLIQHKDKVYAVVMLIDSATGSIVNAAKCHVEGSHSVGVSSAVADRTVKSVEYFDISGRRVIPGDVHGPVIERTRYTDGSQSAAKKFVR